jgi:hypothetical protein
MSTTETEALRTAQAGFTHGTGDGRGDRHRRVHSLGKVLYSAGDSGSGCEVFVIAIIWMIVNRDDAIFA